MTGNTKLAETMRILGAHGINPKNPKFYYDVMGFNYRFTNLQAAVGVAQMKKIDSLFARRRWTASIYAKAFVGANGIVPMPEMPWAKSLFWFYSILVDGKIRDKMIDKLGKAGIEARPFFVPIHKLPIYKSKERKRLPVAEDIGARGINLPSYPRLSESQIHHVAKTVIETIKTL